PEEIERPVFQVAERKREVISVVLRADLPEDGLRSEAEIIRDELLAIPGITQIELNGVRNYEISIEIPEFQLRKYKLTFDQVAKAISDSSVDLPAGNIKTRSGEIQLRTVNQAYTQKDFENIPLITNPDGTDLRLGDIATIIDGFEENPIICRYNGEKAAILDVYRVGSQNAITISDLVKNYVKNYNRPNVKLTYWRDRAKIINNRLDTLIKSAIQGGILVFILLALFLRFSIAVWVCIGIPISFMGTLACMPYLDVTINVLSLFAFILVLGIVVDDAIVTGENIYTHLKKSKNGEEAAINGTVEVSVPVTFGVLTTVAAFIPLTVLEGRMAPIFNQIPFVVIPVLMFSLVESKLILPSHLKHLKPLNENSGNFLLRIQQKIAGSLEVFVEKVYQPVLRRALEWRYLTVALFIGITLLLITLAKSGRVGWTPFPRVDHEVVTTTLEMPLGTDFEVTKSYLDRIEKAAYKIRDKYVDPSGKSMIQGILYYAGTGGNSRSGESHEGQILMQLIPPEFRTMEISARKVTSEWRSYIGELPGEAKLSLRSEIMHGRNPIDIRLKGPDFEQLDKAADEVKEFLRGYAGVFDIGDSFEGGKEEIRLKVKPEAEILGISSTTMGRQVRQAFFGAEAQRIQRGRDDVRVMVRYPEEDRKSVSTVEDMKIRLDDGTEVPFSEVADVKNASGYAKIFRVDRHRTINVFADVDKVKVNMADLNEDMAEKVKKIISRYPKVEYSLDGESKDSKETTDSLMTGLLFTVFAIYALLAIPFKSYIQPLIVMSIIPFGLAGAILGHMILGMSLSMLSLFGMLALAGVVVNDSLVLVDYVNKKKESGMSVMQAAFTAGGARFRPILLTSLTTFAGLTPLLLEKSTQAQFLIPMAVSLGFGILYATFVTLFLVPANYLVLEDVLNLYRKEPVE
ncbi:MAG: efflux RND transporter permease subunit, partial [Lentisphaeraceae bacterium]|nr:efflux RND transporter permease subunit [Lentisphaeraceae bacterium]